jgi:hypothetical protein
MDDKDKVKEEIIKTIDDNQFEQFKQEAAKGIAREEEENRRKRFAEKVLYAINQRRSKFFYIFDENNWDDEKIYKISRIPFLDKFYKFFEECRLIDKWTVDYDTNGFMPFLKFAYETGITEERVRRDYSINLEQFQFYVPDMMIEHLMQGIAYEIINSKIEQCLKEAK